EGVLRTMFLTKVKTAVLAAALVCLASLALVVVAAGQPAGAPPGEGPNKAAPPQAEAVKAKVRPSALTADALAKHLGIVHTSFELSFAEAPAELTFSVDVYEDGKRTVRGQEVGSMPFDSKKHPCTVLFSPWRNDEKQLEVTLITASGTFRFPLANPFPDLGVIYPGPRLDPQGRILLAAKAGKGVTDVRDLTLDNA